jgi:transketolase
MFKKGVDISELKKVCKEVRKDILRMLSEAGSGHTGGALSCVEILVSLFYAKIKHDPNNYELECRDRFILSKGHGCPALYTVFAHRGYLEKEELMTLRKYGSRLQGHPHKGRLPFLESSSGSLGQGLSISNGMALSLKLDKKPCKVYCLMGDGELNEGQVWEAIMTSAQYKLDNLCVIIDRNMLQIDGPTEGIMGLEPLDAKWKAFNWEVIVVDGHNIKDLISAYDKAEKIKDKPVCIIAKTAKGKGVSFMENKVGWHGVAPNADELKKALEEIDQS